MGVRALAQKAPGPGLGPAEALRGASALSESGLLERVALALNSTLELKEVLKILADIALSVSGAARCALFVIEDSRLLPVVATGKIARRGSLFNLPGHGLDLP